MSVPPFRPPVPEPLHPFGWLRPSASLEFRVTQTFDQINPAISMQPHHALDMGNGHLGAELYAPADGTVLAEGWLLAPWSMASPLSKRTLWGPNYGGIMVVIDHGNGYITALAHMARTIVNKGQTVKAGQQVGNLGATGAAAEMGGHVHWDLYHNGVKVDPWPLLAQNWVTPPDTSTASPEDTDMRFSGAAFATDPSVPRYPLIVGANFRAEPSTQSAVLQPEETGVPKGTIVPVAYWVDGESLNGDDQWAMAWLYVGQYRQGFFHRSVLGAPSAAPAADCTNAVKAATAPLTTEITTLQSRISAAKKALG